MDKLMEALRTTMKYAKTMQGTWEHRAASLPGNMREEREIFTHKANTLQAVALWCEAELKNLEAKR